MTRSGPELVAAARRYLGASFVHQGRQPDGPDCAGLLRLSLLDLGWPESALPDIAGYGRAPWRDGLRQTLESFYGPPAAGLEVGDVVLAVRRAGMPISRASHIAIVGDYVLGGFSLIHTRADIGKVVEHRMDEKEAALIVAVYR